MLGPPPPCSPRLEATEDPHAYEIYVPPYLCNGPRPMNVVVNGNTSNSATVLAYAQQFPITYSLPGGATVEKVVLMRPGSVTHSFDFDQRYVQLAPGDQEPAPGQVWAKTPAAAPNAAPPNNPDFSSAPRGYYMLFLVTNTGVPSVARWVRLQ